MNQCLDLVLLDSPTTAFLLLLIFGPDIFNFLKLVSPSSSTTKISPSQHPDNAGTSCLIILWTLISLCKCTPRSSGYFSLWDLTWETTPNNKNAQGRPPTTSWTGGVPTSPGPGKVFCHITRENLERTPSPLGNWVHSYQPGGGVWLEDSRSDEG